MNTECDILLYNERVGLKASPSYWSVRAGGISQGSKPVEKSAKLAKTKSLSPVSQTSQNFCGQLGGSIASVPNPGALSREPSFWFWCQSATYVATLR